MRLLVLALLLVIAPIDHARSREITHEDIKDAMLSMVHMMRENTEKLERHEARERLLGEQLKKTLSVLTKRVSVVDGLKGELTKINDRISGIEQLIAQRDERERIQMQKTADTLEDLESRLEGWLTDIENKVAEVNMRSSDTIMPPLDTISPILSKINNTESLLIEQVSRTESALQSEAAYFKETVARQTEKAEALLNQIQDVAKRIGNLETSLENVKEESRKFHEGTPQPQFDSVPGLEEQTKAIDRVQQLLQDTSEQIRELPRINEIQTLHNETQTLIQETNHALKDVVSSGVDKVQNKISETTEESKNGVGALRMDLANNAERVNHELRDIEKAQSVMVSMADHVLDTKKRVEYGVHQILLEVGDLLKAQGSNINNTLNERFDGISNDIMNNQNGALSNLSNKMEQEMNQVWRQINVMYQQMTESAKALEKLHTQNEAYVNETTSTMGGMESKVSEITKRMMEVDENLNYLLGRLSLVTQEFNQIKSGLGAALDNIKASFKEVQDRANDLRHPGPHPIPENYKGFNDPDDSKPDVLLRYPKTN